MSNLDTKKRKSIGSGSSETKAAKNKKKTYEELECELLVANTKLLEMETKLLVAEAQLESTNKNKDDNVTDNDDEPIALDPNDPWNAKYLELREYRIVQGHCKVPEKGPHSKLGYWVTNQKRKYAKSGTTSCGKLSQQQIILLDGLGFHWGKKFPAPMSWDNQFQELEQYRTAMGHCNIHIPSANPSPLAKWVSNQRLEYKRFKNGHDSLLTSKQIGRLNGIGFQWNAPRLP